jgi:signal transduction histidine kinase
VLRWARRSAWLLSATTLLVAAVGLALLVWDWSVPVPGSFFGVRGFSGLFAVSFGGVGALLTWRRPGHLVGWVFAAAGMVEAVDFASFEYGLAASAGRDLPFGEYVGWLQLWIWVPFVALITVGLFLLFPAGRLPGPRWRPVSWIAAGATVIAITGLALTPGGDRPNLPGLRNPFGVAPSWVPFDAAVAGLAGLVGCAVLAASSLYSRARRGPTVERQQIRWLAYSGCLVALVLVPSVSLSLTAGIPGRVAAGALMVAVMTMPLAVAVAVLKYRLYDLDIVVRKTVVAALVAGSFTAIYVLVVVVAGAVTGRPGSSALTFVAAALAAVFLQPVRVRAGLLADRLVYGKRATPFEVLSEFSEQVAGTYSLADVLPRLAHMLGEATGAERAEVWMRSAGTEQLAAAWLTRAQPVAPPGGPTAAPDPELLAATLMVPAAGLAFAADPEPDRAQDGRTRVFEVEHQGERLGSLRVTSSPREPLTPAGERLVQAVAGQAGLVLRNVVLIEDLRASRQRLVAAADEARRGLERDLHDGAQQQLIALRITLGLARQMVQNSPEEAASLLAQTEHAAADALDELRDLARGIYPPLLADLGLAAALEAQAQKAALPVTIEARGTGRYSQEIEAALYFSILEALQNTAKYAQASAARVTLCRDGQFLVFTVDDDGTGFDQAKTSMGTGMQGMADRMAALGGSLQITSAPGRGTQVTGRVPASERCNR